MDNSQAPGMNPNVSYDAPSAPVFGPGNSVTPSESPTEPAKPRTPSKARPLVICLAVVLLIGAGVAGFFLYQKFKKSSNDDPESLVTLVYTTPADSEDPEADYLEYLKSNTSKAKSGIDKLSATSQEAAQYISMGDFESARSLLAEIDESKLKTNEEKYTYYNALANLYSEDALNDSALCAEYREKEAEVSRIMDEEAAEKMREKYASESE